MNEQYRLVRVYPSKFFLTSLFALKVESRQISPKFGRFLPSQNLLEAPLPKVVHMLSRLPRSTSPGKVSSGYSH